jgi:hypothetical protein
MQPEISIAGSPMSDLNLFQLTQFGGCSKCLAALDYITNTAPISTNKKDDEP